jgi:hypothetical protein
VNHKYYHYKYRKTLALNFLHYQLERKSLFLDNYNQNLPNRLILRLKFLIELVVDRMMEQLVAVVVDLDHMMEQLVLVVVVVQLFVELG